jgi:hypothetical protein
MDHSHHPVYGLHVVLILLHRVGRISFLSLISSFHHI